MIVKLRVGDTNHVGWEKVEIKRSLYSLAGSFDLSLSPVWNEIPEDYALYAGAECEVTLDDTPVITGFIDRIRQSVDSSNRTIQVEGRDRTADLVDCSFMGRVRCWQSITFKSIVEKLVTPFKIPFKIEVQEDKLYPTWGIQEESIFDNLSKAASLRRLLLTSNRKGELIATRPSTQKTVAFINESSGVLNSDYNQDYSGRYSYYESRVQNFQAEKVSEADLKILGRAKDDGILRYRPLLIPQEGAISTKIAEDRLNWERDVRVARSNRVEIALMGWTSRMGNLWDYNQKISVSLPKMGVSGDYLITGVTFILDSSGQRTTLECEGLHAADIDPTLDAREHNVKRAVEEERNLNEARPT